MKDIGAPDIPALYNVVDLQRICQKQDVRLSADTNRYLLYSTLRKIGAVQAQKLIKKLVEKGEIKWEDHENFEVEAILDYVKDAEGKEQYEIKWKGWSMQHNTWEPIENLECKELLADFHAVFDKYGRERILQQKQFDLDHSTKQSKIRHMVDRLMETQEMTAAQLLKMQSPSKNMVKRLQRPIRKKATTTHITNKRSKAYKDLKKDQEKRLKEWEQHINKINTDPAPITVENSVDLEGPPPMFTYINDYKAVGGIDIPTDPIVGCECTNCVETKKQCCGPNAGAENAYFTNKRVRVPPGHPIYECNKRCSCDATCSNRVVQHGRKHKVAIFRTSNGRGWGVKAMQRIPKGSFVMQYVGEVITFDEAEHRGKVYDAEGMTYLFDLDYNDGDCPYTVDARSYGNVSHFVNHSCDPNLAVYGVWINTLDPRLPRIAMFAKKDIAKGEELTFDYMMTGVTEESELSEPEKEIDEISTVSTSESASIRGDAMDIDNDLATAATTNKENKFSVGESDLVHSMDTVENTLDKNSQSAGKANSDNSNVLSERSSNIASNGDSETLLTDEVKSVSCNFATPLKQTNNASVEDQNLPQTPQSMVTPVKISPRLSFSNMTPRKVFALSPMKDTEGDEDEKSEDRKYNRRSVHCPPAMKYRLMCQCGAEKCRKYLY